MTPWLRGCVLAGAAWASGCTPRSPASMGPEQPRYVVGAAYQAGGSWFYPREDFGLDETGLAYVMAGTGGRTANGEAPDPAAMTASHATLQLPVIVRVTNLETGLQALVRVDDRGPGANRLLGLSHRAAEQLGVAGDGVARVRMQVDSERSQALRDTLGGQAVSGMTSARRDAVMAETLAPPPGVGQSTRLRAERGLAALPAAGGATEAAALPTAATRVPVQPGQLWLRAGEFGQPGPARIAQAKLTSLGAAVQRAGQGRAEVFRLRAGPYATVAEADMALDQAARAGVTDARIVVE